MNVCIHNTNNCKSLHSYYGTTFSVHIHARKYVLWSRRRSLGRDRPTGEADRRARERKGGAALALSGCSDFAVAETLRAVREQTPW